MHLIDRIRHPRLVDEAILTPPFGPGFSAEEAKNAAVMEVWGTSMDDQGEYTQFILIGPDGNTINRALIEGY